MSNYQEIIQQLLNNTPEDIVVKNWKERRSDNADLTGYCVYLKDKKFIMYYDKDTLREVYFMYFFPKYCMSCRTDMKTISHYYSEADIIKRYENGIHNKTYYYIDRNTASCIKNNKEVLYIADYNNNHSMEPKLRHDLINFLSQFYDLKLYEHFTPKENNWLQNN